MFQPIPLEKDIDSIVRVLEDNCNEAKKIRSQIRELQQQPGVAPLEKKVVEEQPRIMEKTPIEEEEIKDEMASYIADYRLVSGDDEETMMALLPDPDSYDYEDVIYRLQAESLREIKEMTEMMVEDPSMEEESREFIENERKKIALLNKFLQTEDEKEEQEAAKNIVILLPSESGRIRLLDDIDTIPRELYGKLAGLIQSVIDGSFKRFKRFFLNTNSILADMAELKGNSLRLVIKRLNKNTYVIVTAFVKKTAKAQGYQENLKSIAGEYKKVENALFANLENPDFMALQEGYVQEMWNKLGYGETAKKYEKVGGQE